MRVSTLTPPRLTVHPRAPAQAAYALLVGVPVGFIGWIEATGCDAFVRSIGGHVIYDSSISLSICAYFCIVSGGWLDSRKPHDKLA